MLLIKIFFICLKSHSKNTFFVLFASFLLCANVSAEIDFQYTFGGSERFDGNNFRISSGAESWAGSRQIWVPLVPIIFLMAALLRSMLHLHLLGLEILGLNLKKMHTQIQNLLFTQIG
jgi:hypothetical protein